MYDDDDDFLAHPLSGVTESSTVRPASGIDAQEPRPVPEPSWGDLDMLMWSGASRIYRQRVPPKPVPAVRMPKIGTTEALPPTGPIRPADWYMFTNTFPVLWEQPIVWSTPYDETQSATVNFYEQATSIFQFEVPRQFFFVLRGISYEVENAGDEDFFDITVLRDGNTLVQWREYVIDFSNTNPAHRYAFAGHTRPMPFKTRFDQNNHLTVQITYKGTKPFIRTPADPFNQVARVNVHGWLSRMRDSRVGAPKYIVDPLMDAKMSSFADLYRDIPRMAKYMAVIEERMHDGDGP